MESSSIYKKYSRKLKQVKVDNWGTFFLQRLLQLYFNEELLDFNIKFQSNNKILKVHKLVITTCTDYFLELEREQIKNDSTGSNMIILPSDMPYECVKSIISFMYTGQLEYWTSEETSLYYTAEKMKMSVLTKLLDVQSNITVSKHRVNDLLKEKNICTLPKQEKYIQNEFPLDSRQSTENKKFSAVNRKINEDLDFTASNSSLELCNIYDGRKDFLQNTEGPSRFDLPEIEDLTLGVFSSFDDITYHTKPILQAPEKLSSGYQENIPLLDNNIDNVVVSINSNLNCPEIRKDDIVSSEDEWTHLESNTNKENRQIAPLKTLQFNVDEKENFQKSEHNHIISSNSESVDSVNNHAKIIREVLKNYPHLVQHNKNIRLKIMQKESKNNDFSSGKTKVSYVVLKSDSLMVNNDDRLSQFKNVIDSYTENNENGPWQCNKCNVNEQYLDYFTYRSHMQDVHGEKFDPRICEHCGYKATKRNILMYHMYTKHNIPPPKSMSFPKCHLCSYVALSESLLTRHINNHKHEHPKSISSVLNQRTNYQCVENFTDSVDLLRHETIIGHEITEKGADQILLCIHCGKRMINAFSLQTHLQCYHKHTCQLSFSEGTSIISNQFAEPGTVYQTTNDKIISVCENNSQGITKTNNKVLDITTTPISILENKQQTIKIRINNDRIQHQSCLNSIPFVVPLDDENKSKRMKFSACDDYQHSLENDDIVEEVVEELETVAIEKCREESHCREINLHQNSNFNKNIKDNSDDQKNCFHKSDNAYNNAYEIGEIVTYVEEETEIVEYETFNNI